MQHPKSEKLVFISCHKMLSIEKINHLDSLSPGPVQIVYMRPPLSRIIRGLIPQFLSQFEKMYLKVNTSSNSFKISKTEFHEWNKDKTYIVSESQHSGFSDEVRRNNSFIVSTSSNILSKHAEPISFWSAVNQSDYTYVGVRRIETGNLAYSASVKLGTKSISSENQERAKKVSRVLVAEAANGRNFIDTEPISNNRYSGPSFLRLTEYILKKSTNVILKRQQAQIAPQWQVLINTFEEGVVGEKSWILGDGRSSLIADPFLFDYKNETYCFVEEIEPPDSIGQITVFTYRNSEWQRLGIVLAESTHLSFPYLFEHENEVYMVPESSKTREINLYKAINFPMEWKKVHTILRDTSSADSLIFPQDGNWWLLSNVDSMELGDHNLELHIWFSDSPLSNDWKPLANNPVYRDESIARNGGLVNIKGNIYRIAQDNNSGIYGRSFHLRRILKIKENEFKEEQISETYSIRDVLSSHHMSATKKFVARDFRASRRR